VCEGDKVHPSNRAGPAVYSYTGSGQGTPPALQSVIITSPARESCCGSCPFARPRIVLGRHSLGTGATSKSYSVTYNSRRPRGLGGQTPYERLRQKTQIRP
jgi:hypothetical protein